MNTSNSWIGYGYGALASGFVITGAMLSVALLAPLFEYGSPLIDRPHLTLVVLLVGAGVAMLSGAYCFERLTPSRSWITGIVGLGLVMRAVLFFAQPIQEDDYYRYLWDGGVVAHGHNPYALIPEDVRGSSATPDEVRILADNAGDVFDRVNHKGLATIYPPLAQACFAVAHFVEPWSLTSWRFVILLFDVAALGMLILILQEIGAPKQRIAIYWWNPILLMEGYNSAHMDVLLVPFVLASVWFAVRNRAMQAGILLALAAAVKLWPVILAPVLIRSIRAPRRIILASLAAGMVVLTISLAPFATTFALGDRSGFVAYGERWEMNDAMFMVLLAGAKPVESALGFDAQLLARIAAAIIVLTVVAALSSTPPKSGVELASRLGIVAGTLFILSPTQFPWYFIWILPFLALRPRASLLVLTATLPLYYLKFYFDARDAVVFFHNRVVWIEYAPVFALAIWEAFRAWTRRASETETAHA